MTPQKHEKPQLKPHRPTLSLRASQDMAREILAEAKQRKLFVSEELRRRLEFYAAHNRSSASRLNAAARDNHNNSPSAREILTT
jgi:hypothetical protein